MAAKYSTSSDFASGRYATLWKVMKLDALDGGIVERLPVTCCRMSRCEKKSQRKVMFAVRVKFVISAAFQRRMDWERE